MIVSDACYAVHVLEVVGCGFRELRRLNFSLVHRYSDGSSLTMSILFFTGYRELIAILTIFHLQLHVLISPGRRSFVT